MARIPLDLIPEDFRRGKRKNPRACLLERALERQYGGKWTVGIDATQRGVMWPRRWSLGGDAMQAMDQFDSKAPMREIFGGHRTLRVTLHGKPLRAPRQAPQRQRVRSRPVTRHRGAVAGTAVIGSMALIGDGLAWVVITAVSVAVAALAAFAGVRIRQAMGTRDAGTPWHAAGAAAPAASGQPLRVPGRAGAPAWQAADPPDWPERGEAAVPPPAREPAARITEADPGLPWQPVQVAEPAPAEVPQPAWPHVPGYDPRQAGAGTPARVTTR